MRNLFFWVLRKMNDNFPSRIEVAWAKQVYDHTHTIRHVLDCYHGGLTVDQIATNSMMVSGRRVTRERIRQTILKGVVQAHQHGKHLTKRS